MSLKGSLIALFNKSNTAQIGMVDASELSEISFKKGPNIDAFGRLRVSQLTTQFDAKQLHDNLPLLISQKLIGSATSSHSEIFSQSSLTAHPYQVRKIYLIK